MISIKTQVYNPFQVNTYILSDETKECIIIDAGCNEPDEEQALRNYLEEQSLCPVSLVTTHCHIDHVLGNNFVKEQYNIPIVANSDDYFLLNLVMESGILYGIDVKQPPPIDKLIEEGDVLKFGNSILKILKVPGHSPGSIVLYSPGDKFLISGDVLFNDSIGRSDLPGGNMDILLEGIKTKLLILPEEIIVYPGHGPTTTIGKEIKNNPYL